MNRRMTTTIVAATVLLAAIAAHAIAAGNAGGKTPPDMSGAWSLDRSQGDRPGMRNGNGPPPDGEPGDRGPRPEGGSGERVRRSEGGPGGREPGPDGPRGDRPGRRPGRLPEAFSVAQATDRVELRDSTGVVIRRILLGVKGEVAPQDSSGVEQVAGTWQGADLVVVTPRPRGGPVTETYQVSADGKALSITTHIDASGDRPARDFTRVYRKV